MRAVQSAELFSCNDDDFVAAVNADVLRTVRPGEPDEFAEARFGVL